MPNENNDKEKVARENLLRESSEVDGASVKGYDFDKGVRPSSLDHCLGCRSTYN